METDKPQMEEVSFESTLLYFFTSGSYLKKMKKTIKLYLAIKKHYSDKQTLPVRVCVCVCATHKLFLGSEAMTYFSWILSVCFCV